MSKEQLTFYGNTDMGKQRTNNEDAFVIEYLDPETVLAIVIDGVGGYEGGEVAAEIAQREIPSYLKEFKHGERLELLKQAVVSANNTIYERRLLDTVRANMSCVLTVALIDMGRNVVDLVHVGDTRIYQYYQGELIKLSHDHSLIGYREEIGDLTEEEAMRHPQRNVISREVGSERHEVEDPDFLEAQEFPLLPNTIFLLCSDGLTDLITSRQIGMIIGQQVSLETKVQKLIDAANEAGGKDNVTVVLVEYQAGEEVKPIIKDDDLPIESKDEISDNDAEELTKPHLNNKLSRWRCVWQNRRKYLSIIVIVLSLMLICLGLFNMMIEINYYEESGAEVFHDLIDNDISHKIIGTFINVLLWPAGILSLCLVLQELFSIVSSKSYRIISAIHFFVIIAVVISYDLLLYSKTEETALGGLITCFFAEVLLCIYETGLYVIKPVTKLFISDFTSKQKLKIIISTSFYALAYICGLVCSFIIISLAIISILRHFFGQTDEYGDFHYYINLRELNDPESAISMILLTFFLILCTFCMNVIHNMIEKKIVRLDKIHRNNEKSSPSVEINQTKKGCLIYTIVTLLTIVLQIVLIGVWANSKPSNKEPEVEEISIVEEETDEDFDKMIRTLDSLGARQEYIDSVSVSSEEIDKLFSDIK